MKNVKNTFVLLFLGFLAIPNLPAMEDVHNLLTNAPSSPSSPRVSPKTPPKKIGEKENQQAEPQTAPEVEQKVLPPALTTQEEDRSFIYIENTPEIEICIKQLFPWKKLSERNTYSFKIPENFDPLKIPLFKDSFQELLHTIGSEIQTDSQGILLVYEIEIIIDKITKEWQLVEEGGDGSLKDLNFPVSLIQFCMYEEKKNIVFPIIILMEQSNLPSKKEGLIDEDFKDLFIQEYPLPQDEDSEKLKAFKKRNKQQLNDLKKKYSPIAYASKLLSTIITVPSLHKDSSEEKIRRYIIPAFFRQHKFDANYKNHLMLILKSLAKSLHSDFLTKIIPQEHEYDERTNHIINFLTIDFLNHEPPSEITQDEKLAFICSPNFELLKAFDFDLFNRVVSLLIFGKGCILNYKFDEIARTNPHGWRALCDNLSSYTHLNKIALKNCNIGYLFKERPHAVRQFCAAISQWQNLTDLSLSDNRLFLTLVTHARKGEPIHLVRDRSLIEYYEFEEEKLLKLWFECLSQLKELRFLNLSNNEFDKITTCHSFAFFLETLAALPNLKILDLRDNKLKDSDIQKLGILRPDITVYI